MKDQETLNYIFDRIIDYYQLEREILIQIEHLSMYMLTVKPHIYYLHSTLYGLRKHEHKLAEKII